MKERVNCVQYIFHHSFNPESSNVVRVVLSSAQELATCFVFSHVTALCASRSVAVTLVRAASGVGEWNGIPI